MYVWSLYQQRNKFGGKSRNLYVISAVVGGQRIDELSNCSPNIIIDLFRLLTNTLFLVCMVICFIRSRQPPHHDCSYRSRKGCMRVSLFVYSAELIRFSFTTFLSVQVRFWNILVKGQLPLKAPRGVAVSIWKNKWMIILQTKSVLIIVSFNTSRLVWNIHW